MKIKLTLDYDSIKYLCQTFFDYGYKSRKDGMFINPRNKKEFDAYILAVEPRLANEYLPELGEQSFLKELTHILNKYSKDTEANTPDYILAEHIINCLKSFFSTIENRNAHLNN